MNGSRKRSRNWVRMAPVLLDHPWPPNLHPARVPFRQGFGGLRGQRDDEDPWCIAPGQPRAGMLSGLARVHP
jgi:hypothetical protein